MNNKGTEQETQLFIRSASQIDRDSMSKKTVVDRWLSGPYYKVLISNLRGIYSLFAALFPSKKVVLEEVQQTILNSEDQMSRSGTEPSRWPQERTCSLSGLFTR